KLHTIKVTTNTRLTPVEYERNVFHLEFDTTGTDFKYEIGDALGVHGQNDPVKVLDFLRKYGASGNVNVDPDQLITVSHPATKADYSGERFESRSALYLFTRVLDLFGRPSKRFYEQLAHYAADPAEKEKLLHLVSKEGADELKERVARTVDHADLLLEFTSARPSLAHLSSLIPAIKPRHYSIASSMKVHPGSVHLLVVLVDWKIPGTNEVRYGQCTRYLVNLQPGDNVVVSVKPSVMKLPPDHRQPVIMAGLGTGMAPFRAFVEERFWLREQGHEVGPMALYFGSRYRASEYLYGDELEAYNHDGLLTYLRLAFSRDPGSVGPDGKKKTYIQHKMQDDSELLHDLLLKQNGAFYLCGPTWPAPDVRDALLDSFSTHGGITRDQAIVELGKLKKEERYVLEVY
ncbi:riboflavin synthase domain-like protein, partial [Ramicandelaber brevisporus]